MSGRREERGDRGENTNNDELWVTDTPPAFRHGEYQQAIE